MRKVFLLGTAREASTRLREKMIRPFGDTSLFEIYVRKLKSLARSPFVGSWGVAIPTTDNRLRALAKEYGAPVIEECPRPDPSPLPRNRELYYLQDRSETHVMWVNGCLPLLGVISLHAALKFFSETPHVQALEPVCIEYNYFWELGTWLPLNRHTTASQTMEPVLASTQAFHIFERKVMVEEGVYWPAMARPCVRGQGYDGPYLWRMHDRNEAIDIDYEEDFAYAEVIWNRMGDTQRETLFLLPGGGK